MPLTNASADAMVTSMASAMGIADAATIAKMKTQFRALYAALKADITVTTTIAASSIVTTGSAATQSGPAAPIPLTGVVS